MLLGTKEETILSCFIDICWLWCFEAFPHSTSLEEKTDSARTKYTDLIVWSGNIYYILVREQANSQNPWHILSMRNFDVKYLSIVPPK